MAEWIIDVVGRLGYAGIALLALLENIFPPIPSELIMPLAGFLSAQGEMGFWGAVAAGSAGSLAGTAAWYWLGHHVSESRVRAWIERNGRWLALEAEDVDRANNWFARRGPMAVFLCRLIPGIRTWISLPAGFARMPLLKFLVPSTAGTVLWTTALTYAGWVLGENYAGAKAYLGATAWAVLAIVVLLYVWRQVRFFLRRRQ